MHIKQLFRCLSMALLVFSLGTPAQAAMVTTSELQKSTLVTELANTVQQREWIEKQLLLGGVAVPEARVRVAAMTDAEVAKIYQRIDEAPAGGNVVLIAIIIFLVLELTGVTNVINN